MKLATKLLAVVVPLALAGAALADAPAATSSGAVTKPGFDKPVEIAVASPKAAKLSYACSMDMTRGRDRRAVTATATLGSSPSSGL